MQGWIETVLGCALVMVTAVGLSAQPVQVQNQFIRLKVDGARIAALSVDPAGSERFSRRSFVKSLKPEFWEESPETKVQVNGASVTISGLSVWDNCRIAVDSGTDEPVRLEPGHTLSQTFTVPPDVQFDSASVKLPTWQSKTSSVTLSLYRGSNLLARKRVKNVKDNGWQPIEPPSPCGEGDYEIRLSEPSGDVGWWSAKADSYANGKAMEDGRAVEGDRAFSLAARRSVGKGTLTYKVDGPKLSARAEAKVKQDVQMPSLPWRWKTTWTKAGYDCSPGAGVLFSRFYTDNLRYMCVQQLKRRDHAGLQFDGCKWIEMDGNADADLRLEGDRLHLHWEMQPKEMSLRFDSPCRLEADRCVSEWALTFKERDDAVPEIFPRFVCSDKEIEGDLNRFWWERGFSYPSPGSGSIEWAEWAAVQWSWMGGEQRGGGMRMVSHYPMTDEGYVHTWGATVGWPLVHNRDTRHFDTNARFILACWRHYLWSGDIEFLRGQADRLRKAMKYQLEVLQGSKGLIVTPEIKTGRHEDLTDNYWDILPFGHLDAYANAYFYGSLTAMEQMENALGTAPLTDYAALREKAHRRYDEVFWNEKEGRYIGCVDIDGVNHDYGFTFVNMEALYYGLGDKAKAERIYHWMETGKSSTGKADIYSKWIFAPRATTIHNPMWGDSAPESEKNSPVPPWWTFWWHGTPFGDQCQDGGAILYTSFYDLMDRSRMKGADDAWKRFGEILERYRMPDRLCGGTPLYLGENPQQEAAGSVGLDLPFPESGMVPCYYLYGVIGVEATPEGLRIRPNLPVSLRYAGVRGLDWRGAKVNLNVTSTSVEVDGVGKDGKPFELKRDITPGSSVVFKFLPPEQE